MKSQTPRLPQHLGNWNLDIRYYLGFRILVLRIFPLLLGFRILNLGFISPAHAQSVGLSISPPVVEILLAPGKKVTQTFNLQTTGENLEVTPELHLALPSDEEGHMTIDPSPLIPSSLPLTVTINNPQSTIYDLTFEAASTDIPQDVYLALVFRASPSSTTDDLRSTITTPAISSLILLTINPAGLTPIDLRVKDFSPPLLHDSWLPLTLSPLLHNNTSIMIRPEGRYEIISPLGKTIFSVPLYPNLILGNSSRSLRLASPTGGSTIHDLPSTISWSPHWSNLGPHRLRLTITSEGGTQITQLEKTLWLLPLRLLIIILTLIFCLLTFIYKVSKFKIV